MTPVETARTRYLSWGAQEREHADYCRTTHRTGWRCWNYLGRAVEAATTWRKQSESRVGIRGSRARNTRQGRRRTCRSTGRPR